MYYRAGAEIVYVEEPVYEDWDCPDGYVRDDWDQCVPEVREVFVIEREILYLYPDLVATYPDLQLHPEFLFRYRPELRSRYANVRSVGELRNRYTSVHHSAPPQRPASAPPARGDGKGKAPKAPGAHPSKHAPPSPHGPPPAQPSSTKPPMTPSAHATSPAAPPTHAPPTQPPPTQHASLTPSAPHGPPPTASPTAPKDKTATSGLFTEEPAVYLPVIVVGGLIGALLASDDENPLEFAAYGAACGAALSVGAGILRRRRHI